MFSHSSKCENAQATLRSACARFNQQCVKHGSGLSEMPSIVDISEVFTLCTRTPRRNENNLATDWWHLAAAASHPFAAGAPKLQPRKRKPCRWRVMSASNSDAGSLAPCTSLLTSMDAWIETLEMDPRRWSPLHGFIISSTHIEKSSKIKLGLKTRT